MNWPLITIWISSSILALLALKNVNALSRETPSPSLLKNSEDIDITEDFDQQDHVEESSSTQQYRMFNISDSCKCGAGNPRLNITKIVGGAVSKTHGWPWLAILLTATGKLCGGTLINNWWILTAAHCVADLKTPAMINSSQVILGGNRVLLNGTHPEGRIVRRMGDVRVHPGWTNQVLDGNDIALVKISSRINFTSSVSPVCLSQTDSPFTGRQALIIGWGNTAENSPSSSNQLREAKVFIVSNDVCNVSYGGVILPSNICAYKPNTDACQGDSGGPMVVLKSRGSSSNCSNGTSNSTVQYFTQVGITSFGNGCARPGFPGVYTRVEKFISWIQTVTDGATYCSGSF